MTGVVLRTRAATASRLSRFASSCQHRITNAEDIWTEHLTDKQLAMLIESGDTAFGLTGGGGAGVELIGSGPWSVARSLEAKGLGHIEGGAPNGSEFPGLYFNNKEAVRILHEFDDEDEE